MANVQKLKTLSGLSTDTKPTDSSIATGSTFYETDTGKTYVYNAVSKTWKYVEKEVQPEEYQITKGIKYIEKGETIGDKDFYRIIYTNGEVDDQGFYVQQGSIVTANAKEFQNVGNKLYSVTIDKQTYNLNDKVVVVEQAGTYVPEINEYMSEPIQDDGYFPGYDNTTFPETEFVFKSTTLGKYLVFRQASKVLHDKEKYIAYEIDDENQLSKIYVGYFIRQTNEDYFIFKFKEINDSFSSLARDITAEKLRAEAAEETLTTALANEIKRAQNKESEVSGTTTVLLNQFEYDLAEETARAICYEQVLMDRVELIEELGVRDATKPTEKDEDFVKTSLYKKLVELENRIKALEDKE